MDMQQYMKDASRMPAAPVGSPDKQRKDLVEQILDFQSQYDFKGRRLEREVLLGKPMSWLERVNNFQILGIASSWVSPRSRSGR